MKRGFDPQPAGGFICYPMASGINGVATWIPAALIAELSPVVHQDPFRLIDAEPLPAADAYENGDMLWNGIRASSEQSS